MRTIYKYTLEVVDEVQTFFTVPKGAKILCVQEQHNRPTLWMEVDTAAETEQRHFVIFGTGEELPEGGERNYIHSVQIGGYVWHVYEQLRSSNGLLNLMNG